MHKILSTELLETLISQGYRYFLSKTTAVLGADADICISLLPVKRVPVLNKLPGQFDTYFKIGDEPRQMAMGVEETIILVDLTNVPVLSDKHSKPRILILDDDQDVLDVLKEIFDYEGFETILVNHTDALLSLVKYYNPALIFLDLGLPGIDGGNWCRQLKNSPELAAIPVIIFTAYAITGITKGIYGCDDFIAKPFDLEDIVGRVRKLTGYDRERTLAK